MKKEIRWTCPDCGAIYTTIVEEGQEIPEELDHYCILCALFKEMADAT